jgi:hypothetical protein
MNETVFPAGKYYVGDPGHVINISWDELLGHTEYFENDLPTFKDELIWGVGALGEWDENNIYFDQYDCSYIVNTGAFSVMSLKLIECGMKNSQVYGGRIVDFEEPFTPSYKNGIITIGHITIDTNVESEDDSRCYDCGNDLDDCSCFDYDDQEICHECGAYTYCCDCKNK